MDYQAVIQSKLNDLLQQNGQPALENNHIHFTTDEAVSYKDWIIERSNIIKANSVNSFLETNAEGRSWIHANLIRMENRDVLITIRVGAKVGNPNPSVNVSFETTHSVRIV